MVSPSRRDRRRTATATEIRQTARGQLARGGPAAVSLRAIAREMGMTAPAIYRYFPSLDALVGALCTDLFTELSEAIIAARDRLPADGPGPRLAAMARAFRHWAIHHHAEFSLMFGEPIPGLASPASLASLAGAETTSAGSAVSAVSATDASSRFGGAFLAEFGALWRRHGLRMPPPEAISTAFTEHLAPGLLAYAGDLPPEVIYLFLSGWTRLYGLVAMEVFGHLSWAVTDHEPLFESEIATFLHHLTG